MAKVTINTFKALGKPGEMEMHYGYLCTVGAEGELIADVPDELLQIELDAKRVTLLEEKEETDQFTGMDRDGMKAYLTEKGVSFAANLGEVKMRTLCRETAKAE
jgi:hypothetical protein